MPSSFGGSTSLMFMGIDDYIVPYLCLRFAIFLLHIKRFTEIFVENQVRREALSFSKESIHKSSSEGGARKPFISDPASPEPLLETERDEER